MRPFLRRHARRHASTLLAFAPLALFATGCGGGAAASQAAAVFPSRAEVASVPAKKPLAEAFGANDVPAETWSFETAPVVDGAAYEDTSPWGTLLRERVTAHRGAALSPALRCAALEIARFEVKHHGLPADSLRRFMVARCGATQPGVSPVVWSATAPPEVPEAEILAQAKAALVKVIDARLASPNMAAGLGVAREGKDVRVVVLFAHDEAKLDASPRTVDANRRVTIHGVARAKYEEAGALINQGAYGVADCDADPRVHLPEFSFSCPLAPGDAFAWVDVLARKPSMHLETPIVRLLVHEGDGSAVTYAARHAGPPVPVKTTADLGRAVFARVNEVRRQGKLPQVTLAAKQSAENTRLAGTMLDAVLANDDDVSERAALGLLAGWDVDGGTIRSGSLLVLGVPAHDAGAWVDTAVEQPLGRITLLDPDARQIAIGPAMPDGADAVGATVTAYSLFEGVDHAAETKRFADRLTKARLARGLPAPTMVGGFEDMPAESAHVLHGEKSPMEALDAMLQAAAYRTGTSVGGYVLETMDVDHCTIPEQLFAAGSLRLALGITHHRVKGAAWGQYVVFFVILDGSATTPVRSARASGDPRAM